jgi:hypothetical protein
VWKSSNIQVVWFVSDADGVDASRAFKALTGNEADGFERNRVLSQRAPFHARAHGAQDGKQYRIQTSPGRVDWFIEPHLQEDESPYERLFDTKEAICSIHDAIRELPDELFGDATRVSVVTTLIEEVATPDEANMSFIELCGIPVSHIGLSDLVFQSNKRKKITESIVINRIFKFSTETITRVLMSLDHQSGRVGQMHPEKNMNHAVRIDLDINTVPSGDLMNPDQQKKVFAQLFEETLAVSTSPSIKIL